MNIKTGNHFNTSTRLALLEGWNYNYARLQMSDVEIERYQKEFQLEKMYRFDRNISPYGCDPEVVNLEKESGETGELHSQFLDSNPATSRVVLRNAIAKLYSINCEQIVISTGIDNFIDILSRAIFEKNDHFLTFAPDYPRFDMYSERMGANPIHVTLDAETGFKITREKIEAMKSMIQRFMPKMIWISNPNNPTGQIIPNSNLFEIIKFAKDYNTLVVVDEAQSEFDEIPPFGSCIHYVKNQKNENLEDYPNLIILRTLSKAYGLYNLQLAFLVTANPSLIKSVLLYRPRLNVTNLQISLGAKAVSSTNFLTNVISNIKEDRNYIFRRLKLLTNFHFIESHTNTFIIRHYQIRAKRLFKEFLKKGIITNPLVSANPHVTEFYLRLAIGKKENNEAFCSVCEEIDKMVFPELKPLYLSNDED